MLANVDIVNGLLNKKDLRKKEWRRMQLLLDFPFIDLMLMWLIGKRQGENTAFQQRCSVSILINECGEWLKDEKGCILIPLIYTAIE